MSDSPRFLRVFTVLASFGFISALSMLSRPSLANVRAVDIVHLIGTGMCFGGAVVALAVYLRSSGSP